ncbi:hypothetical protein GH714_041073 [Hevea brasiliensis]|uniref:Ubiquitin receptor RAD23 n=1 Tax=Hevea brasiliensis TaxID=3981 RepID=A0A6A6MZ90_HEVBR|nr:hypothetical protein GH714_041073 [Hevea brasiliensis]
MLIYQGKVLKDNTTIDENKVAENSFVVIMLTKNKSSAGEASTASTASTTKAPQISTQVLTSPQAPLPTLATSETDVYGQAASNLVAGSNLEGAIQQILDMGGGLGIEILLFGLSVLLTTILRELLNTCILDEMLSRFLLLLEFAFLFLFFFSSQEGIPEQAEVPPVTPAPVSGQVTNPPVQPQQPVQPSPIPSSGPNANPLDLFPQGVANMGSGAAGAGTLDFLRNSQQFQALRAMVQANPQILQPMLQELGKQNPHLMRLIQEHQADFLRLINEPVEGGEGNILGQLQAAMPQTVTVTPEEREAIERLEAMGFDRALVLEVFFACNKNEELAANYLLDHMHEFED